jgi:hypothetical protein
VTAKQRNVLIGLATALVVLVVVLVVVAAGRHHASNVAAAPPATGPSSTDGAPTTATTVALVPLDSSLPVPPAPATTVTVATSVPPSTTTTVPPVVTGAGAVLRPPAAPDHRIQDPSGCQSLADPGWGDVKCGTARTAAAALTWLTEARPGPAGAAATRTYVFKAKGQAGTGQDVVLEALDDNAANFTAVNARVDDVAADGHQQILFGFRSQGTAERLLVDLVTGDGVVSIHRDLVQGSARTAPGQLDTWSAVLGPGDPTCCPSSFEHDTIRYIQGAWRIAAQATSAPNEVPPSQV